MSKSSDDISTNGVDQKSREEIYQIEKGQHLASNDKSTPKM